MTLNKVNSKLFWCSNCLNNSLRPRISFDEKGWCNACQWMEEKKKINWGKRRKELVQIIKKFKSSSAYDCIVPVSGGKDSFYRAHIMATKYGLKPLLMTYHGNNFLPEGDFNRDLMREVFDADHIVWGPSISVLKKLNVFLEKERPLSEMPTRSTE